VSLKIFVRTNGTEPDAGYPIEQATAELVAKHPEWEKEDSHILCRWV